MLEPDCLLGHLSLNSYCFRLWKFGLLRLVLCHFVRLIAFNQLVVLLDFVEPQTSHDCDAVQVIGDFAGQLDCVVAGTVALDISYRVVEFSWHFRDLLAP